MALRGFADVISGGITEIVTVSSLASALHFALGPTEGNGMSSLSSSAYLCDCIGEICHEISRLLPIQAWVKAGKY